MRRIALLGAGAFAFALLAWLAWRGAAPPPLPDSLPAADAPRAAAPVHATRPAIAATVTLLSERGIEARPGHVRIGLARVPAGNSAARIDRFEAGDAGPTAGPSRYEDLAVVERWLDVPATRLPDGRVQVGPLRLPHADRYDVQALGSDGLHVYFASFTPTRQPAPVRPTAGAGLRVRNATADTALLLRRLETGAHAPQWQALQAAETPALLQAFDETALPVTPDQTLAPLAPNAIEVVVQVAGVEAERRRLALRPGAVTEFRIDTARLDAARAASATLELELIDRATGLPADGLRITWIGNRGELTRTTGRDGLVRFEGIDRTAAQAFNLQADAPAQGLPRWPAHLPFALPEGTLDTAPPGGTVRHRVELTPFAWIVARTSGGTSLADRPRSSPYPILVLQREHDGRWVDAASDYFLPHPSGTAVSVTTRGRYRVDMLESPWRRLRSSTTDAGDGRDGEVVFAPAPGRPVELRLQREGRPLANAPVRIVARGRGLPPAMLRTDAQGRIGLTGVTEPDVLIDVPGSAQQAVRLDRDRTVVELAAGEI